VLGGISSRCDDGVLCHEHAQDERGKAKGSHCPD
jgi:hypothetical protein